MSIASCGKPKPAEESSAPESGTAAVAPESAAMSEPGGAAAPAEAADPAMATPAPAVAAEAKPADVSDSPYATVGVLIQDLTAKLQAGDWNGFLELAGPQAATGVNRVRLRSLIVDRSYRVKEADAVTVTDRSEKAKLMAVKLQPGPNDGALGEQQIEVELVQDQTKRWGVTDLRIPDILALAAAKMAGSAAGAGGDDPLAMAGRFLEAVIKKDFATARRMVDTAKLSDEKLAALFIVVEEGSFKPHSNKPLISTIARNNVAWIIARLESPGQQSDFGIEMARAAEASPWQIIGLNFSKLIQKVASQAGAGDIAYSPLQTDLKGGEQIVIYFEFDGERVNPRAEKQLGIIGDILRADANRTLTINGHADALGFDDYNKELSEKRAEAVRQFLMTYGIPGKQIITQGFGESAPKAPNVNPDGTDNPSGRAQNRRAEVYLKF